MNWTAFQVGGMVGCSSGILFIATLGSVFAAPVLVPAAIIVTVLIWALVGNYVAAQERATDVFNNSLTGRVVRSSTDFAKTTTGKVVTGVTIAGLVTSAAIANVSSSKQVSPTFTQVATSTVSSSHSQIAPTEIQPTMVIETLAPTQPPECAQLNLTPELCSNYGYHSYSIEVTSAGDEARDCQQPDWDRGTAYLGFDFAPDKISHPWAGADTLSNISGNTYQFEFHYNGSDATRDEINTFVFYVWGFEYESKVHLRSLSDRTWVCAAKYTLTK